MPIVATVQVLMEAEDSQSAMGTLCRVLTLAAAIQLNGIVDWDFPKSAQEVEITAFQLEERPGGYLLDATNSVRRH